MKAWRNYLRTSKWTPGKYTDSFTFFNFITSYFFWKHNNLLKPFLFRAKASLLDPAAAKDPPRSKPPSPPRETAVPESTTQEMEQTSSKAASPTTETQDPPPVTLTKDSPHTATSVDKEVEILGSRKVDMDKPSNTLSKIPELEITNEALNRGKDTVSLSSFPDFKTMDFSSMMSEYLTRSSQHRVMEDSFLTTLQQGYEVCTSWLVSLTLLHIYAVAPKLKAYHLWWAWCFTNTFKSWTFRKTSTMLPKC